MSAARSSGATTPAPSTETAPVSTRAVQPQSSVAPTLAPTTAEPQKEGKINVFQGADGNGMSCIQYVLQFGPGNTREVEDYKIDVNGVKLGMAPDSYEQYRMAPPHPESSTDGYESIVVQSNKFAFNKRRDDLTEEEKAVFEQTTMRKHCSWDSALAHSPRASVAYLQQESTPGLGEPTWALAWMSTNRLVAGSADGHLRYYDPTDLAVPLHDVAALPLAVSSVSASDAGYVLATSLDGTVVLVQDGEVLGKVETGREKVGEGENELPAFASAIHPHAAAWAWSGRSSKLAIRPLSVPETSGDGAANGEAGRGPLGGDGGKVVDTGKGRFGMDVRFSPDGRQVALATESGHVVVVDTETQTVVADYASHAMASRTVSWSANSQWLFSGSDDNRIVLHDVRAGSKTGAGGRGEGAVAIMQGHQSWVLRVSASPDGRLLGSGSADATVKLWDVAQRACVSTTQVDADVWGLAWQPAAAAADAGIAVGKQFAICGDDQKVTLFRAAGSV
ncbi:Ski complex subunit Rec14 [Cryptotrichosporon argae]